MKILSSSDFQDYMHIFQASIPFSCWAGLKSSSFNMNNPADESVPCMNVRLRKNTVASWLHVKHVI